MSYNRLSALAAGLVLASGSAAIAQQKPPPPPPPSTYDIRHPNAQKFVQEYNSKVLLSGENKVHDTYVLARNMAACVARSAKGKAGELVGGAMTSDANYQGLTQALRTKHRNCVTQQASIPIGLISGALAEELLRMESPALQDRSSPAAAAAGKSFYAVGTGVSMDKLGRCLAVHSPGLVYRVLGTAAGSADETRAIAGLLTQTPECLVTTPPKDIPASEQRSALANGLYHWVHRG